MTETQKQAIQLALNAIRLAATSHNVTLTSYPLQDAWVARHVDKKLFEAKQALDAALAEDESKVSTDIGPEWKPCVKLPITVHVREQVPGDTHISTREGITPVKPDDLIMRGVEGELYPIGRELFERTYRLEEELDDKFLHQAILSGGRLMTRGIPAVKNSNIKRNREADRERFPDPDFNRWLDEGISDAGHTVWDAIGDVFAAWAGWENRAFYHE